MDAVSYSEGGITGSDFTVAVTLADGTRGNINNLASPCCKESGHCRKTRPVSWRLKVELLFVKARLLGKATAMSDHFSQCFLTFPQSSCSLLMFPLSKFELGLHKIHCFKSYHHNSSQ